MRQMMMRAAAAAALAAGMVTLSACAHKDLIAPCSRDGWLWSFGTAYASDCGRLLPVNR